MIFLVMIFPCFQIPCGCNAGQRRNLDTNASIPKIKGIVLIIYYKHFFLFSFLTTIITTMN